MGNHLLIPIGYIATVAFGATANVSAMPYFQIKKCKFFDCKGPYERHYNPWFVYFFTGFLTAIYTAEQLMLQTIFVLNNGTLQSKGLKSMVNMVSNQEQIIMTLAW